MMKVISHIEIIYNICYNEYRVLFFLQVLSAKEITFFNIKEVKK